MNNFKSKCILCWHSTLEEFDYKFYYLLGKTNVIADMLSQYLIDEAPPSTIEEITAINEDDSFLLSFQQISTA